MQIKAIITDLDRTLLHTDKTISPYTLEVFRTCKEKGIVLLAATAIPEVLAVADHIVRSNDEDGVARFVKENVL